MRTEYKISAIMKNKILKFAFGEFLPKLSAQRRPLSPALPETTLHSLGEAETTLGSAKYKLGAITISKF